MFKTEPCIALMPIPGVTKDSVPIGKRVVTLKADTVVSYRLVMRRP
jgi:hypothetical protein